MDHDQIIVETMLLSRSLLASYPGPLRGGERAGTHCTHMHKVYGEFSDIISRIPLQPRGREGTNNI